MNTHLITAGLLIVMAGCCGAETRKVAGVHVPLRQGSLELQGAGLLRKGFVFKIYVGALYTHPEADFGNLANATKRIDIYYFHSTPKKHMIRAAEQTLKKNLTEEQIGELATFRRQLHEAFLDGKKGGMASIIHTPGSGLSYRYNDVEIIAIPSDHFANAYFSIWLGEHPSSKTMKRSMLGKVQG